MFLYDEKCLLVFVDDKDDETKRVGLKLDASPYISCSRSRVVRPDRLPVPSGWFHN